AIDVERHVRSAGDDSANFGDRRYNPAIFHLVDIDDGNPVLAVEIEVVFAVHRSTDSDLDEPASVDEPFFDCAPKRRAVKILTAEVLVPGVDVRIELNERERPMPARQRAQHRQ